MFKKIFLTFISIWVAIVPLCYARAIVDNDVLSSVISNKVQASQDNLSLNLMVFLVNRAKKQVFIDKIKDIPGVTWQDLSFISALNLQLPKKLATVEKIANFPEVAQL